MMKRFSKTPLKAVCLIMAAIVLPSAQMSFASPASITGSLENPIKVGSLLITFKTVETDPSCGIRHGIPTPKAAYKCLILKAEARNMGGREIIFDTTTAPSQEYVLEVDTGYFYSPEDSGRALRFRLQPGETGESSLLFRILAITNPIKLHGRIIYRERPYWEGGNVTKAAFVLLLDQHSQASSKP